MPRVLFYVQHLWGVGHVYRATRIAHGLVKNGFEVHLVWGGTTIPGFDFEGIHLHQLPAVRTSDASFSQLLHADGSAFAQEDETRRCEMLLSLFDEITPDILITEAFPFGRRQMRFELLPLLDKARTAKHKPLIAASIRDIMQEDRKEKRVLESNGLVKDYFDLVLVHGDEKLIPIKATLQGADAFMDKVRYTGLVTPQLNTAQGSDVSCDVLVTVGGGAFGQKLTTTALEAMKYSNMFPSNWLVSAGSEMSENDYTALCKSAPEGMKIVRYIPNLANTMRHVKVSVSHAGYNTVCDILKAKCASVLYPYTGGRETEQLRRAEIMDKQDIAVMLSPDELTPAKLAKCVDEAAMLKPSQIPYNLDGAVNTAQILKSEYESHQSESS